MDISFGRWIGAAAGLCAALTLSSPVQAESLAVTRAQLKNGLDVVLNHDPGTPFAVVSVVYDVGSRDNPLQKSGLAHLTEHMMFRRTEHVADNMFFEHLRSAGATYVNGSTGYDNSTYVEIVPTNALALALWLESERMGFLRPSLSADIVAAERTTLRNERAQKRGYGLIVPMLTRLFPENHPYHRAAGEIDDEVRRITVDDVRTFVSTYYVPNNAHLVVSGMFDPAKTMQMIRTYFERIPRGRPPVRSGETALAHVPISGSHQTVLRWRVAAPIAVLAWRTPALYAAGDGELDLVALVLCNRLRGRTGRRFQCQQSSHELASVFTITAEADARVGTDRLFELMNQELRILARRAPPSTEELDWARGAERSQRLFQTETLAARASLLALYARVAGTPDFFRGDLQRYFAADASSVQAAARDLLDREGRLKLVVQPTTDEDAPDVAPEDIAL